MIVACRRHLGRVETIKKGNHNELSLLYSDRESNPDLLFRRELFYPLNYQSILNVLLLDCLIV